jgi:hypothetical protein
VKPGVHAKVPDVFEALVVNVLPVVAGELVEVREEIASPSGSDALTVNDPGRPTPMLAVAGAVTTGARSVFWIVSETAMDEVETPSLAVNVRA